MPLGRFLDMMPTSVNVVGDMVVTTLVADKVGALDRAVFQQSEPLDEAEIHNYK